MTVACHVIPVSGRLVDVDILELSKFQWPGVGICHARNGETLFLALVYRPSHA